MAKNSKSGADKMSAKQNAKMGDIFTAAKSTMGPADYSQGYPAPEGALHNSASSLGKKK